MAGGREKDGSGKLVEMMLGVQDVGLGLSGGRLFVVSILDLLVCKTLVACIVENDLGRFSSILERKSGKEATKRDGLGRLVRGEYLNALGADLDGFRNTVLDGKLSCEARPVLGWRTFVGKRLQKDLDILCRRERVEVKRNRLVDRDGKVERPAARRHGGNACLAR